MGLGRKNCLGLVCLIWVLGSAVSSGQDSFVGSGRKADDGRMTLSAAQQATDHLRAMGIPWDRPWTIRKDMDRIDRLTALTVEEWRMLAVEADAVRAEVTDDRIKGYAESREVDLGMVGSVASSAGVGESVVVDAIRTHVAILERAERWGAESIVVSDESVDRYLDDVLRELEISTVVFNSKDFMHLVSRASDDVLESFFAKQQGDSCASSRYVVPHRVRFEYIGLTRESIVGMIKPDVAVLKAYWEQHREARWDGSVFEDVRGDVERVYRTAAAGGIAQQVMEFVEAELREPWRKARVGANGYPEAPELVRDADYLKGVAAEAARRFGVVLTVDETGLLTVEKMAELDGIGLSRWYRRDDLPVKFQFVPFSVEGIKEKPRPGGRDWALAMYEPTEVLMTKEPGKGGVAWYVGRVVQVSDPVPATDMYWQYESVRADWQRHEASGIAEKHAKRLLKLVASVGVDKAWEVYRGEHEVGEARVVSPEPFAKRRETGGEFSVTHIASRPTRVPGIEDLGFAGLCFALAEDVEVEARKAATPPKVLAGAMPLSNDLGWAVVEFRRMFDPPKLSDEQRVGVEHRLRVERFYRRLLGWFDSKAIRKRAGKRR